MTRTSVNKFDSFHDLLKFGHSLRFPSGGAATGALAQSGLYDDRSHAGISDRENDFCEMKDWLSKNALFSKSDDSAMSLHPETKQKKLAAGLISAWENYKLSFVAMKNKAWVHPFGVESSLCVALAKDFTDETIDKVFEGASLPQFCIREAKKARDAGIGIHQAYGSYRKMVQAFYDKEVENGLMESSRPQFVIQAKKLIDMKSQSKMLRDHDWKDIVDAHITADVTPDHVYAIYEQIRKLPKGSDDVAKELYGKIFETPYRINSGSLIVHEDDVVYEVGSKVMINCSRTTGTIESIDGDSIRVESDEKYTLSLSGISFDVVLEAEGAKELSM